MVQSVRHGMWPLMLASLGLCSALGTAPASAQRPDHPRNLQVLPRNLSTDSVFTLMLGVADALGVSCGHCHPGGDNPTWDSTNFTGDVKPTKRVAREMFRLVDRLNHELLPAAVKPGLFSVPVTCITCHRGALRPILIEDTLAIILDRQGVDSAIAEHRRIRERYRGRMTYDLSDWPLRLLASRLAARGRHREAVRVLEEDARLFPDSGEIAYQLGTAYEDDGDRQRAIMQYHKVLSLLPAHKAAQRRLRALTTEPTK